MSAIIIHEKRILLGCGIVGQIGVEIDPFNVGQPPRVVNLNSDQHELFIHWIKCERVGSDDPDEDWRLCAVNHRKISKAHG